LHGSDRGVSERAIVFLIGAVQFVNILDFLMVMPLGPDFAVALGIPTSQLGYISGSYTAAAAVSGLAGAFFLDRFDRRSALAVAMGGLVLGTAAGGLARGLHSLMAARLFAGCFGGPATSLSFSIIADVVPESRRGKAVGAVMGAFSVASIVGVPLGLELARTGGWRRPFFTVAGIGLFLIIGALSLLPPMRGHLGGERARAPALRELFARPTVLWSYTMTAATMTAGFILIPNISTFVQKNLGYPRAQLGLLYGVGGVVSFLSLRVAGRAVDRFGSLRTGSVGVLVLIAVVYAGFDRAVLPVVPLFITFMMALACRNVAYNTLTSKVPSSFERARFMSIQSAVQHAASAAGAFLSSRLLTEGPGGQLIGMPRVAGVTMALTAVLPLCLYQVESRVRRAQP
jgi:predicted MFS family arabinose efflux permease